MKSFRNFKKWTLFLILFASIIGFGVWVLAKTTVTKTGPCDVTVEINIAITQVPAKFFSHDVIRQVGDVPQHAGDTQTALRFRIVIVITAFVKLGIGTDSLSRHFVKGNVLGGKPWRSGDDDGVA